MHVGGGMNIRIFGALLLGVASNGASYCQEPNAAHLQENKDILFELSDGQILAAMQSDLNALRKISVTFDNMMGDVSGSSQGIQRYPLPGDVSKEAFKYIIAHSARLYEDDLKNIQDGAGKRFVDSLAQKSLAELVSLATAANALEITNFLKALLQAIVQKDWQEDISAFDTPATFHAYVEKVKRFAPDLMRGIGISGDLRPIVEALKWSPDSKYVVIKSNGNCVIYDTSGGIRSAWPSVRVLPCNSIISWSPNSKYIGVDNGQGGYEIYDMAGGAQALYVVSGKAISWSSDSKSIGVTNPLYTVDFYDVAQGVLILSVAGSNPLWSPDNRYLGIRQAGFYDMYNIAGGIKERWTKQKVFFLPITLPLPGGWDLQWSPDSKYFVIRDRDSYKLYGAQQHWLNVQTFSGKRAEWSPDSHYFLINDNFFNYYIYDTSLGAQASWPLVQRFPGNYPLWENSAWSPNSRYCIIHTNDSYTLYDTSGGARAPWPLVQSFTGNNVGWSPDSNYFVLGVSDHNYEMYDTSGGAQSVWLRRNISVYSFKKSPITFLIFDANNVINQAQQRMNIANLQLLNYMMIKKLTFNTLPDYMQSLFATLPDFIQVAYGAAIPAFTIKKPKGRVLPSQLYQDLSDDTQSPQNKRKGIKRRASERE